MIFRLAAVLVVAALAAVAAVPAGAASPDYQRQFLKQQKRALDPVRDSAVRVKPTKRWLETRRGKPFGSAKPAVRSGGVSAAASSTPGWIDGVIDYQSGTNCVILGGSYTEQMVGGFTGYWGATDVSYPKIGDRYWGHIYMTAVGNTCPYGIADVQTEITLPAGTQLAINPQSSDPNDKIRCYVTAISGNTGEATNQEWVAPWDSTFRGKYCDSTQVSQGPNGLFLGYRLLAQGQSFHIVFPLQSTRKLSGIAEPQNASRLTSALSSGVNTFADPYQWVFVGDRPVEASCPALGPDAASAITNNTAHTKNFMCNWYRSGKVQIEIGEQASGGYQASSPQYNVEGQYQGYYFDQDWNNLTPGTTYHWRLKFVDDRGTPNSSGDDQTYYSQPRTFTTTGTRPAGPSTTPGAGAGGSTQGGTTTTPGGDQQQQQQDGQQQQQDQQQQDQQQPRDTRAPTVTSAASKPRLKTLLKKGLIASVTCDEACSVAAQLQIPAKTAKKLKLGKKLTVIGKGAASAPLAGKVSVPVKLTKKAKRRLKRTRKLTATLVVVATDSAGNRSTPVTRKVKFKR
jgi:hypothetical protein